MSGGRAIVLINGRQECDAVVAALAAAGADVEAHATADRALPALAARPARLILLDARVYPGFGCTDAAIREVTALLPDARFSENLLRWQIALRVLDAIRAEGSVNRATPVFIHFPALPAYHFSVGDELTQEAIEEDLKSRQPVVICHGGAVEDCAAAAAAAWHQAVQGATPLGGDGHPLPSTGRR